MSQICAYCGQVPPASGIRLKIETIAGTVLMVWCESCAESDRSVKLLRDLSALTAHRIEKIARRGPGRVVFSKGGER